MTSDFPLPEFDPAAPFSRFVTESQVREDISEESLQGMVRTIREVGVLQPIRVRRKGDLFVVVDGERRFRAAQLANLPTVPVVIEPLDSCPAEILHKQLIANCQRLDLNPMERARGLQRLMELTGWSVGETTKRMGFANGAVTRSLALLELPADIQAKIETGAIAPSAAYELAQLNDPQQQTEFAEKLARGELTRDAVAAARKASQRKPATTPAVAKQRVTAQLGDGRAVTVKADGLTLESFIGLLEEVLSRARKVRPSGVELATFVAMLRDQSRSN